YDVLLDEEGIDAIAEKVVEKLDFSNARFEVYTNAEPTEEVVEEVVEEVAVVEEPVEEVVEEVVEEPATEPAAEEVAVAAEPTYQVSGDELVDAETGLVIRLKRSFTAKMKQSEENVKGFYSALKNELTSYKKVNSHVSWHGDRFNLGRDTIARMNICGKTLCLYLDLDPEDPEFKQTVYHQKNVTGQKAYEGTPFMVKIKSDAAVKKATRLVTALAEKYEAEKEEEFVAVDYAEEFAYETTTKLLEDGLIRTTKEKKVALDF
ncbi:MAG: hypothetical protein IJV80_02085, partial [Clostridia bacterium]|nr:hypothetical protein [Clostridia bacterium]